MDKWAPSIRSGEGSGNSQADPPCSSRLVLLGSLGGEAPTGAQPETACHRTSILLSVVLESNVGASSSGLPSFSNGANGSFLEMREQSLRYSNHPRVFRCSCLVGMRPERGASWVVLLLVWQDLWAGPIGGRSFCWSWWRGVRDVWAGLSGSLGFRGWSFYCSWGACGCGSVWGQSFC